MYTCKYKKETTKAKGTLYLSHYHACFSADIFGRKLKEKIHIRCIKEIKLIENNNNKQIEIELTTKVKSFLEGPGAHVTASVVANEDTLVNMS